MSTESDTATVDGSLRLGDGLDASERDAILERFASLDSRFRSFRKDSVDLLLTVKERDTPSQRTTLEAKIAGTPRLVATSNETEIDQALNEVRDDLLRQITDARNKSEPRNNRRLRRPTR